MYRLIERQDAQVRMMVDKISSICLSTEFHTLKEELEAIYRQCGVENSPIIAFQDALYALLTQNEEEVPGTHTTH